MVGIRNTYVLQVIVILGFLVALFPPTGIAQETAVPLNDAINSGDVSAQFSSTGAASGHIADLSITSNAGSDITLDLDSSGLYGKVLANPNPGEQDEVITDTPGVYTGPTSYDTSDTVTLAPGGSARIPVVGYCLNFDLDTPSPSVGFDLQSTSTKTDINDISTVMDTLEDYQFPGGFSSTSVVDTTQMAIWTSQPENNDNSLQEYEDRGYSLSDSELDTVNDILDQSGVDTENIDALSGQTQVSERGVLGFPWGYPWGYPWGLPFMGIPCYTFLIPLVFVIIAILLTAARRIRRRPKTKKPDTAPGRTYYAKTRGPVIITPTKPRNCDKLIEKCEEARKAAEAAELEAKEAMKKANDSYFDFKDAGEAANEAQEELRELKENPPDEGAWMEMDGTRITSRDLKLRKEASGALWDQYRAGDIDAHTLEKRWEELGESEALDELRQMDQTARHEKAEKAVDVAKEGLMEAEINLGEAKDAANKARDNAAKAKELADRLCKEADDCVKKARAEAARVAAGPPTKVTARGVDTEAPEVEAELVDKDTEETEETTETTEETTEKTETTEEIEETTGTTEETDEKLDKKKKKPKKKGKPGDTTAAAAVGGRARTDYFGPRLGEEGLQSTRTRPRTGDGTRTRGGNTGSPPEDSSVDTPPTAAVAAEKPKGNFCGSDVTGIYLKALNDIASRLRREYRDAPGGAFTDFWGARAAYGIAFLAANGMEMDFYVPNDPPCPTDKCQQTATLLGECVVRHALTDLIYGICAGFFGVPACIQDAGAHVAELAMHGGLDPKVSQDIYRAGNELGEMVRDKPAKIGASELGVTVMKIESIKRPDCKPCPKPATGTIDGHDFTKHDWVWP